MKETWAGESAAEERKAVSAKAEFKELQIEMGYVHQDGTPRDFGKGGRSAGFETEEGVVAVKTEDEGLEAVC